MRSLSRFAQSVVGVAALLAAIVAESVEARRRRP